jgi:subtilisin family serine protease
MFCTWRKIYATTPNDTFKYLQGTSMVSNVAGVAAIIRSYYPLTTAQVKHILMDSGVAITENVVAGNQRQPFFYYFV